MNVSVIYYGIAVWAILVLIMFINRVFRKRSGNANEDMDLYGFLSFSAIIIGIPVAIGTGITALIF